MHVVLAQHRRQVVGQAPWFPCGRETLHIVEPAMSQRHPRAHQRGEQLTLLGFEPGREAPHLVEQPLGRIR